MQVRILSAADVRAALSMAQAVELMSAAFAQLSAGTAQMPPRLHVNAAQGTTLVMPALLETTGDFCVKVVSVYPANREHGLPPVPGLVIVLDAETGMPRALLDGHMLTLLRSGGAGGLSAQLLARQNASSVAVIGAGGQARSQLQGVMAVRTIQHVHLVSRTIQSANRLKQEIESWPNAPLVETSDRPNQAVEQADIVIVATNSYTPVLDGRRLQPGTHVVAVGSFQPAMQELDIATVERSRVVVDSRAAALAEAGDLIEAGLSQKDVAEIGEIVNGVSVCREHDKDITLFKSVGVAVQDAAASRFVADQAERMQLGTIVEL